MFRGVAYEGRGIGAESPYRPVKEARNYFSSMTPIKRKLRTIPLVELRADPDAAARRVRHGEVLLVMKRSKPLFRLIKPYEDESRVHHE